MIAGSQRHTVTPSEAGSRLDRFCAARHPERSRARLTALIKAGAVRVDGALARPAAQLVAGAVVTIDFPPIESTRLQPAAIPLAILYEDEALLVLDKPPGLVMHPGSGTGPETLAAALLHHDPRLAGIGGEARSGLVHRLDKGTSGVLVVARTDAAHRALAAQFRGRSVEKWYDALVWGRPRHATGRIELPVGRDPKARVKMSTRAPGGRAATSLYRVEQELPGFAWVAVQILTGRTHQVRVHLAAIGHPLLGDATYGGARAASVQGAARRRLLSAWTRPALHARSIAFEHPVSGERLAFTAPWPADLQALWQALRDGA